MLTLSRSKIRKTTIYFQNHTLIVKGVIHCALDGTEEEFTLVVGETIDFICKDPDDVKQFRTTDPELLVSFILFLINY